MAYTWKQHMLPACIQHAENANVWITGGNLGGLDGVYVVQKGGMLHDILGHSSAREPRSRAKHPPLSAARTLWCDVRKLLHGHLPLAVLIG